MLPAESYPSFAFVQPLPLIAILAGGRSRRLGTDKAALPIGGTTWLAHIARAARQTRCRVAVVGRNGPAGDAASDPTDDPEGDFTGVTFVPDKTPGLGPMGGLFTALRYAETQDPETSVLLAGCDMPFLSTDAFNWLLDQIREGTGPLGLAVRSDAGLEPLFAGYRPAARALVELRIAERRLSLRGLLDAPAFRIVPAPTWVNEALSNINTAEDRLRFGL
jgi:molybdopterin-guanine dinucleotide biosynthesis protein A